MLMTPGMVLLRLLLRGSRLRRLLLWRGLLGASDSGQQAEGENEAEVMQTRTPAAGSRAGTFKSSGSDSGIGLATTQPP
jgi:hypothetical protein